MGKKKKTGKGSKKGGKKGTKEDPNAAAALRAAHEAALLRQNLARRNIDVRAKSGTAAEARFDLSEAQILLNEERESKLDISTDLTRQFKTMQSKLVSQILDLQHKCKTLESELKTTQTELQETKDTTAKILRAKDEEIFGLTTKINSMETAYENILTEAFDSMAAKVEQARDKWETESYMVQRRNKDALLDFGLSHSVSI